MIPYEDSTGRTPDFTVRYEFLHQPDYEVQQKLFQQMRCDWFYASDDPLRDSAWMIWPQFVSPDGAFVDSHEVPETGAATMWIVNRELVAQVHAKRLRPGVAGFLVVGQRRIASAVVQSVAASLQSK